jgi:hypothetical protein
MSSILHSLAQAYERTQAARTGEGERDLLLDYEEFLRQSGCANGERRAAAEQALLSAERTGLIQLERHKRDSRLIQRIRFASANEEALFRVLGTASPAERREQLARFFEEQLRMADVPDLWRSGWEKFFGSLAAAARSGGSVQPFDRANPDSNAELALVLFRVLQWQGESLMRFASCILSGDSKSLERLQPKLNSALATLSDGRINSLEDVGIVANPRFVLLHGPVRMYLPEGCVDFSILRGPVRISEWDINRAVCFECLADRALTIENETTFHELAKVRASIILVQSTYAGSAVVSFLRKLPDEVALWHFGDSDPAGFDILRDLRGRVGKPICSIHMGFRSDETSPALTSSDHRLLETLIESPEMRTEREELLAMQKAGRKGRFEQESLGRPTLAEWPFYR